MAQPCGIAVVRTRKLKKVNSNFFIFLMYFNYFGSTAWSIKALVKCPGEIPGYFIP